MIFENFKKTLRFIFYTLFFVFFACNESDSIILNPPNPNTFQAKSFMLDENMSNSIRSSDFNAGNSPISYIGNVDANTESSLLIKIDKEIVFANEICEGDPTFKDIEFKLVLKKNLIDLGYDLSDMTESSPYENQMTNADIYNGNNDCSGPIFSWQYQDVSEGDCSSLENNSWSIPNVVLNEPCGDMKDEDGNLIPVEYGCCKYWDCIACCQSENCTNEIDDDGDTFIDCLDSDCHEHSSCSTISYDENDIFNAYILDNTASEILSYDEETSNSNHQTEWLSDAIVEELDVTIEEPFLISINLYDYLTNQDNQDSQNFCELDSDIFILLRLNQLSSSIFESYIEFYSTDGSNPLTLWYKPHIVIAYDELTDVTQDQKKFSIDNEEINFNTSLNSNNVSYNIHNADSINIVAFSNNPLNTDCACYQINEINACNSCSDCNWNENSCVYNLEVNLPQLPPIINSGYSDELFNFDITIDEAYLDLIELKDTLNDIIKFRFDNVYFIFQDEDPLNDNWHDYGTDGCPDQLENGEGGCLSLQDEPIYDSSENSDPNSDNYDEITNDEGTQGNDVYDEGEGTESNVHFDEGEDFDDYGLDFCPDEYEDGMGDCLCDPKIEGDCVDINAIYNINGYENNEIYDEDEYFDSNLDTGSDGCFSMYEDGNGYCLCDINVEGDCVGVVLIYNNCDDVDADGICDESYPVEYYNPDPNGDDFSLDPSGDNWNDYGSDGCPDELENGFGGCLEEGELATVPDPNEDNFDDIFNDQGSQGNNSFDAGEGYEDNLQYDYDLELSRGEDWIDAGIDQLWDIHEPGYDIQTNPDPHGDNWNDCGQDGLCEGDYGWTNSDIGEKNGQWELGEGLEKNLKYDLGEWYFDDGLDHLDNDNEYNLGYDEEGKENNNEYDAGEDFSQYDIGFDLCPNEYEDGEGGCLCDYINYLKDDNDNSCDDVIPQVYGDHNNDDFNDDPNTDNTIENNGEWDFSDWGIDGCPDELENGSLGCLEEGELATDPDPNGDNYDSDSNPTGTEGNEKHDYDFDLITKNTFWEDGKGEKFETFYDEGEGDISENEENYFANYASTSVTPLFYIYSINDLEINEFFDGEKTNSPDENVFLWIDSVTKTSENQYKVSVHLETFIDLIAFQIHLDHDYFEYTEEMIEEKQRGLWPYEGNIYDEDGKKYILDASIYDFDESFCEPEIDGCTSIDLNDEDIIPELLLSYGHGMKSNLVFKDSEGQYFYEFMEELKESTQFTVFSDEYTRLLLYFDLTEGSLHNVDEFTEIKVEYYNEEEMQDEIFPIPYQSVILNQDYIAIPIVGFMQSYLVSDYGMLDESFKILLSASSERFNFSKIKIDPEKSRIEVFYSE